MSEPVLSIIIPVYNVELYLRRCLDSILNQTYSDYEIILINDGSTDCSGQICDEYAAQFDFIVAIHKDNGGQSSARNVGLSLAKGKYISFVDSDDFIHPQMYEILLEPLLTYKADLSVCSFERYTGFSIPNEYGTYSQSNVVFHSIDQQEVMNHYWYYAKGTLGMAPWNKVYKKEIFVDNFFKEGIIYEDHYILPEIIKRSKKISITDKKLYYYFQSPNSTMRSGFSKKNLSSLEVWEESIFPFLYNYSNRDNIDLAENYYLSEFKRLVYKIMDNGLKKGCVISKKYKRIYKKLVTKQHKINPQKEGWFFSFCYFLSLINTTFSCWLICSLFHKRGQDFWSNS